MKANVLDQWQADYRKKGVTSAHLPFVLRHPDKGPRRVFVLVHGLGESPNGMRHLAQFFFDRGNHVVAVLLDGHGTSPESLHGARLEHWRDNVDEACRIASALGNETVLGGFSLGSSLAVDRFSRRPDSIVGLYLYAPVLKPSGVFRNRLLQRLEENLPWHSDKPFDLETNPFTYPFVSMQGYRAYLQLSEELETSLKVGPIPPVVSVVSSKFDWIVDWNFLERFNRLFAADCFVYPSEMRLGHNDTLRAALPSAERESALYQNFLRRLERAPLVPPH